MEHQPYQRSSGGSSSSRKGKKSADPDKPKKIYRGLGIAELEKIRLGNYEVESVHNYAPPRPPPPPPPPPPPVQGFYSMTNQNQEGTISLQNAYPSAPPYFTYPPVFATSFNGFNGASQMEGTLQHVYPSGPTSYFTYPPVLTSSCNGFNGAAQSLMIPWGDMERRNVGYADHSHYSTVARWNAGIWDTQQQYRTLNFQTLEVQETMENQKKKSGTDSVGPGSQNSGSSGSVELDLELKLDIPSGRDLDLNLKL